MDFHVDLFGFVPRGFVAPGQNCSQEWLAWLLTCNRLGRTLYLSIGLNQAREPPSYLDSTLFCICKSTTCPWLLEGVDPWNLHILGEYCLSMLFTWTWGQVVCPHGTRRAPKCVNFLSGLTHMHGMFMRCDALWFALKRVLNAPFHSRNCTYFLVQYHTKSKSSKMNEQELKTE